MALIIQSFNKALIISDYYLNTARYALKCENKAKVELHCNGHCQMTKKLKQEDEKDKKNPERRVENHNDFYFFDQTQFDVPVLVFQDAELKFPFTPDGETIDRPHSIFKPPTV